MAQSYQHTREVDIIGGGGALLFGAVSVFVLVTSYGAPDAWASFVTLAILALFFLWLYLWEGKVRYQVHQDGLHFTRFFRDHVLAWSEVEAITWNEPLHAITIRSNGRNRLFISTDFFPGLHTLLKEVWTRSGSDAPSKVEAVLAQDEPAPDGRWPGSMFFAWRRSRR